MHSQAGRQVIMYGALLVLAVATTVAAEEAEYRPLGKVDVGRVEELYHIADQLGDSLWPGFDVRRIPIGINNMDKEELLVAHPSPPEGFVPYSEFPIENQTMHIMDGCTRYGPRNGGWAVEVGGVRSAYVGTKADGLPTEDYISLIIHECFHVFQRDYREMADGAWGELPELDTDYSSLLALESRILHAILTDTTGRDIRETAKMFVAVRQERREDLPADIILSEGEEEYNEGTATYIQARMYELLARNAGIEPKYPGTDPHYRGFESADSLLQLMLGRILPPPGFVVTFFHSKYNHGMALGLVLDRARPDWKREMSEKGSTQFGLLEKELPVTDDEREALVRAAKVKFRYRDVFTEQERLITARTDTLLQFLEVPGRRYRVFISELPPPINWKPHGPVYKVPSDLMYEVDDRLAPLIGDYEPIAKSNHGPTIWLGGIEKFEMAGLRCETKQVPVIFRMEFFEWIDPEPAEDGSDLMLEFASRDGDVYSDLTMTTDGFVLRVPKAHVVQTEHLVAIYPQGPW
ncbi:MAG: hypothetical protein JSW34_03830 [Candidatus Zixiibacteriota bacterium]|nr:MAG: hypothetical protein JSW34_03830 [candidate division Zixibacteria bacterium]